jgi:thioredoxin reductase (NADPH)
VRLDGQEHVEANTIILTTGVEWRRREGEGIRRLAGKGVFYGSVTSDPAALIGKRVFIVGGGNSAGQAAMALANYAKQVTILVRGWTLAFSMSRYLIDQLGCKSNVKIESCTELISVAGRGWLESIRTAHAGEEPLDRRADALYVMIGADAVTGWLPKTLQRDEDGFICTGRDVSDYSSWTENRSPFLLETNLPGLFCAGDVRHGSIKRVSSAVGEGSMAINSVHQVLALQGEVVPTTARGSMPLPGGDYTLARSTNNTN